MAETALSPRMVAIKSLQERIQQLESRVSELAAGIQRLQNTRTYVLQLSSLAPEPFELVVPISVAIEGDGEDFTASVPEANMSASGETEADAIANLKYSLVSKFEIFEETPPEMLGELPLRQWSILQSVIRRVG